MIHFNAETFSNFRHNWMVSILPSLYLFRATHGPYVEWGLSLEWIIFTATIVIDNNKVKDYGN